MPLRNFSGDIQQEYFVDGITEELIRSLAETVNLHAISRMSVMSYKHSSAALPKIAAERGADLIVEGSIAIIPETGQQDCSATDREALGGSYISETAISPYHLAENDLLILGDLLKTRAS